MSAPWQDVRYALRRLRQSPGFLAIAVAILALGIGANTAIFSFVDGILLRPLPYRGTGLMISIFSRPLKFHDGFWTTSMAEYSTISRARDVFSQTAFVEYAFQTLTGLARPETVVAGKVPSSFFATTGAHALFGRVFSPSEEKAGKNHVAVLSYVLWQRQFGGQTAMLGKTLQLDGRIYSIVGVLAPFFQLSGAALWVPLDPTVEGADASNPHRVRIFARLQPGIRLQQAQAALDVIARQNAALASKTGDGPWGLVAVPYFETLVQSARTGLLVLFGAVGLVLLIVCANLSNLLLARGLERSKELAIRSALGATRARVLRILLTESLLVSFVGGLFGLLVAWWGVDALLAIAPPNTPRLAEVSVNAAVFAFALAAASCAGILAGLAPAWRLSRQDVTAGLKEGAAGGGAWRELHFRNLLVGIEVALCVMLLAGSLLAVRSFLRLLDTNLGFRTDHLLSLQVSVPHFRYPKAEQHRAVVSKILERIQALPGVEAASAMDDPILRGATLSWTFAVESGSGVPLAAGRRLNVRYVTSDYFRTLGLPFLSGHGFDEGQVSAGAPVAVVNQAFGKWDSLGENPVGAYLLDERSFSKREPLEIIGVVGDARERNVRDAAVPTVYLPYFRDKPELYVSFLVRSAGSPGAMEKSVQQTIWSIDPYIPIREMLTLNQAVAQDLHQPRFQTMLFSAFGVLGLVLALVGIYGVIAFSLSRRTQELGLRMALGARPAQIVGLLLRQGMLPVMAGIVVGIGGALGLTRLMRSLLYEVSPTDPATLAAAIGLMVLVSLLACIIPARRAARIDPVAALRSE